MQKASGLPEYVEVQMVLMLTVHSIAIHPDKS
jgi:hypothetical protein